MAFQKWDLGVFSLRRTFISVAWPCRWVLVIDEIEFSQPFFCIWSYHGWRMYRVPKWIAIFTPNGWMGPRAISAKIQVFHFKVLPICPPMVLSCHRNILREMKISIFESRNLHRQHFRNFTAGVNNAFFKGNTISLKYVVIFPLKKCYICSGGRNF